MTLNWDVDAIIQASERSVKEVVVTHVAALKTHAVNAITSGPKTGRLYPRGGRVHQASAPGEAPANDGGTLIQRTEEEIADDGLSGAVVFKTRYAAALEFGSLEHGTGFIAARPYARPALEAVRPKFEEDVKKALREFLK